MSERTSRTELLLGEDAMKALAKARVAVFGVGGVGGYAAEALARGGVGNIDIIDSDTISESNINRQIIALSSTVGQYKADAVGARIKDISPDCRVKTYRTFFLSENKDEFDFRAFDYVIDAIDTVQGKLALIECANAAGTPVISSMGTGNKLDPTMFTVADIYETSVCPLARIMRSECRKKGIKRLKVVYSKETPFVPSKALFTASGKAVPGSVSFVPPVAGFILAGEVIKDIAFGRTSKRSEDKWTDQSR